MSKRARITLEPPTPEMQSDGVAEAILAAEQAPEPPPSHAASDPQRKAKGSNAQRSNTLLKIVLAGVAVAVAVWLFRGRRF